jgi:hypothetical protein
MLLDYLATSFEVMVGTNATESFESPAQPLFPLRAHLLREHN